jgi:NUMOD4 motif
MRERWAPIENYENLYEISNLGKIRVIATKTIKAQSGGPGTNSRYRYVTLYKKNKSEKLTVHRLVAKAFVPNPKNLPYALHIKNNRENNAATNLKWGTQLDNHKDAVREGTYRLPPIMIGVEQPKAKLDPEKIRQIRNIRDSGKPFTQVKLAAQFGISRGTLRSILANKHWRHVI